MNRAYENTTDNYPNYSYSPPEVLHSYDGTNYRTSSSDGGEVVSEQYKRLARNEVQPVIALNSRGFSGVIWQNDIAVQSIGVIPIPKEIKK